MNPDLEKLVMLQAIDLEGRHLRARLAAGPQRVARAQQDKDAIEASLRATRETLTKEEARRRRLESDADDRRTKIARLRKQMDSATSAAQIAALEHEITFAQEAITKAEDEELASLERTEAAEKQEQLDSGLVERLSATLERVQQETAAEATAARAALAQLESERAGVRADIDEGPLAQYDRVTKSRGTGVSEAVDHKCAACQMMVRPQRWNDLTSREHAAEIFTCETCGRMLFWDPRRDAPGPWPAGDRLTAARAQESQP